jgi:hypothetical protein
MYNDNLSQINNLQDSNSQIRNILVQILTNGTAHRLPSHTNSFTGNLSSPHSQQNSPQNYSSSGSSYQRNRGNSFSERRVRGNSFSEDSRNSRLQPRRLSVNTNPFYIDFIGEYEVPLATLNQNNRRSQNPNSANNLNISQLLQSFLQPVEIIPTQSQIEAATRRVQYCDIVSPNNTSCPISMEEFNDNDIVTVIRHCSHIFNTEQITNWFTSSCRCPVCRYDIREYNSNVTSEFYQNPTSLDVSFNNPNHDPERMEEQRPNISRTPLYDNLRSNVRRFYNNRHDQQSGGLTNQPEIEAFVSQIFGIDTSGNIASNTDTINFVVSNLLNMANR